MMHFASLCLGKYNMKVYLLCVCVHRDIQLSQYHLSKRLFFYHWTSLGIFVKNQLTINVRVEFWTLSSTPFI